MKIPLLSKINKKIGLDLGSKTTRIWVEGKGVVFSGPTCLAIDILKSSNDYGEVNSFGSGTFYGSNKNIIAVGLEAQEMDGKVGDHIKVIYPVKNGEIYDDQAIKAYLKIILNKWVGSTLMLNPIIMVSVPASSTQADREIVTEIIYDLGASEVYTIAQPLAASIGAGVPIADSSGSFFLHLGEGVVEGAVISLGSIISLVSSEFGGEYFSQRIIFFLKENLSLNISKSVAEVIIREIISVDKKSSREKMIGGQDSKTENPKEMMISSDDLMSETVQLLTKTEELIRDLLSKMPTELTVDVIDKGLLISGGLANIKNIEDFFVERLGIPVTVVDNPENTVIEGIGTALEHLDLFKSSLGYGE